MINKNLSYSITNVVIVAVVVIVVVVGDVGGSNDGRNI